MRLQDAFELTDVAAARELVRRHPFATIVTADLRRSAAGVVERLEARGRYRQPAPAAAMRSIAP